MEEYRIKVKMNYPHIAQLGRLAAMEKMGQRAVSKALSGVKPPKLPKVPKDAELVKSFKQQLQSPEGIRQLIHGTGDLESLSPMAKFHQQRQYAQLMQAARKKNPGFTGPLVMPGHPAFKYPDLSASGLGAPSRYTIPSSPGKRAPGQAAKLNQPYLEDLAEGQFSINRLQDYPVP